GNRVLEHNPDRRADGDAVQVAVNEIGEHGDAFVERDVGDGERLLDAPHHAVGVDFPGALRLQPLGAIARAEGTHGARIVMELLARVAALEQKPALARRIEERLVLRVAHARSRTRVAHPWREARWPPVPLASASAQFFTCTAGCASPRSCRT